MSAPHVSPKRWLVAADDTRLLNVDFVAQLREDADGKLFALIEKDEIEIKADPDTFDSMKQLLSNGVLP